MKSKSLGASKFKLTVLTYVFLILGAVIMVFPFVWMILTSLKTVAESNATPPVIFPREGLQWKNLYIIHISEPTRHLRMEYSVVC